MVSKATGGGQTLAHSVRMANQVIKQTCLSALVVALAVFGYGLWKVETSYYSALLIRLHAQAWDALGLDTIKPIGALWESAAGYKLGSSRDLSTTHVLGVTEPIALFWGDTLKRLGLSAALWASLSSCALYFLYRFQGRRNQKRKVISGTRMVSPWLLKAKLKLRGNASPIRIGKIPLIKNSETKHIMLTGGTGSGKSTLIQSILKDIRLVKQKAVVVDTTGEFVSKHFQKGRDKLLSLDHVDSEKWNPWAECSSEADMRQLVSCLVPSAIREDQKYWSNAARSLLFSLMKKFRDVKRTQHLAEWLLHRPLKDLSCFLEGTPAAAHMDPSGDRTAMAIRSSAIEHLEWIELLDETSSPFSIRDWMEKETEEGWLFLSCTERTLTQSLPLLAGWVSIVIQSIISMPINLKRRVWLCIDELPSFGRIESLETFVTRSRKYGGCGLFAMQSPAQLVASYGHQSAQVIGGNCSTRVAFSEKDPQVAEDISKLFGYQERVECQEGISYGAHQMRDGVSISRTTRSTPVISPSEIQKLRNLEAIVRLSSADCVCRTKIKGKM